MVLYYEIKKRANDFAGKLINRKNSHIFDSADRVKDFALHRIENGTMGGIMAEKMGEINSAVNAFVWGRGMLVIFLGVGMLFTLRTGFFQFTGWKVWMGETLGALFRDRRVRSTQDHQSISQFQSFCTALAATLGTGNITGVATAIVTGGPGAVFWMWVSAFLGMMTIYAENVLGIKYRYKSPKGVWVGGAMVYMERGLGAKWLAVIFAVFCLCASFGMGNMTQANAIAKGIKATLQIPEQFTGMVLMALVAVVILGGVKRVAKVAEKIVPFMAAFYILGGLFVIVIHYEKIPETFLWIFEEAFGLRAVGGGVAGYGMNMAVKMGISRGVFSNEAGLGSSVMAHAASDVSCPQIQGMWGMAEVFIDTIVVCTVTALAILTSGVYDPQRCLSNIAGGVENIDGTTLTGNAFATVFPNGDKFLAISIALFAFATIIGWAYFGERTAAYLFGERAVFPYKMVYILILLPGAVLTPELVWELSDTFNGLMAIPNLTALMLLHGEVIHMTREYQWNRKRL